MGRSSALCADCDTVGAQTTRIALAGVVHVKCLHVLRYSCEHSFLFDSVRSDTGCLHEHNVNPHVLSRMLIHALNCTPW